MYSIICQIIPKVARLGTLWRGKTNLKKRVPAERRERIRQKETESGLGDPWMHGSWPLFSLESLDVL